MSGEIYRMTVGAPPASQWPWGFFVFRTTYSDQDLWERYMKHAYQHASCLISSEQQGLEILPFFELTRIEDRARLEGASKETVWEMFTALLDEYPEGNRSRGIAPVEFRNTALGPRYDYCLYVDDECLQSFANLPKRTSPAANGTTDELEVEHDCLGPDSVFVVLTDFPPWSDEEDIDDDEPFDEGEEAQRNEPIDPDYKWMHVQCQYIGDFFYEMIGGGNWDHNWGLCKGGTIKRPWVEAVWLNWQRSYVSGDVANYGSPSSPMSRLHL